MLRFLCLLLCIAAASASSRWESNTRPSICQPISTAEDVVLTASGLSRGDAVRLCFEGASERCGFPCLRCEENMPCFTCGNATAVNITVEEYLHIPEHAQMFVDCRGGSIALLTAPSLAYGSLLGFSHCHFTSFRHGQSDTAKPSEPEYMLNWEADNALLLLKDSFLEQPCSVFGTYALMPLFAAGSPHETARIGPLAPRWKQKRRHSSRNAYNASTTSTPAHASSTGRRLADVEETQQATEESSISPQPATGMDPDGDDEADIEGEGESEGEGDVDDESTEELEDVSEGVEEGNGVAVSYIEMHVLAPLSDMVVHFDNVTTWCAPSWEDAEGVAYEALELAETEGPQPTSNDSSTMELVGAAQALRGNISDTPWATVEACRVCSPLPIAVDSETLSRTGGGATVAADTASPSNTTAARRPAAVITILCSIVGLVLLLAVATLVAQRKCQSAVPCLPVTKPRGDHNNLNPTPPTERRLLHASVGSQAAVNGRSSPFASPNLPGALQSPTTAAGELRSDTTAPHSQKTLTRGVAAEHISYYKLAEQGMQKNPASSNSHSSRAADAAASGGVRGTPPLALLRLPDATTASPLSVNSGCGTPGYGTSGCYTPYSAHTPPYSAHTPPAHAPAPAAETSPSEAGTPHHSAQSRCSPARTHAPEQTFSQHASSPTTTNSFALEDFRRHARAMHDTSFQKLAWTTVDQSQVDPMQPAAVAPMDTEIKPAPSPPAPAGDVNDSGAFVSCTAELSHSLGGFKASSPTPPPPPPPPQQPLHATDPGELSHNTPLATAASLSRPGQLLARHSAPATGDDSGYSSLFSTLEDPEDPDETHMHDEDACSADTVSVQFPTLPKTPARSAGAAAIESAPVARFTDSTALYDSLASLSCSKSLQPQSALPRTESHGRSLACVNPRKAQREGRAAMRAKRRQMPRAKRRFARRVRNTKSDDPVTARDLEHLGSLPTGEDATLMVPDATLSVQGNNQLRVFRVLGAGGFATVFHGEWRGLEVAIKKLDISSKCAKARARLAAMATEATIASNLVHPNVVATYTHGLSTSADAIDHTPSGPGRPSSSTGGAVASGEAKYLMVQEYCNGGSLRTTIVQGALGPATSGGLERRWLPLMHVAKSIAEGMRYLHSQRILHGDLNPANILLKVNGKPACPREALREGAAVKITDFGLSHRLPNGEQHAVDMCVGTPFFMAPEVLALKHFYPASDVYSFGVIMWELMTGTPAFVKPSNATPNSPQQNNPLGSPPGAAGSYTLSPAFPGLPSSVPLAYSLALRACLHPEPLERPTFTQLSKVLTEVVSEVAEGVYVNSKGLLQVSEAAEGIPFDDMTDCIAPDCSFIDETSSALSRRMLQSGFHAALSGLLNGSSGDDDAETLCDTLRTDVLCTTANTPVFYPPDVDNPLAALCPLVTAPSGCNSAFSRDGSGLPDMLASLGCDQTPSPTEDITPASDGPASHRGAPPTEQGASQSLDEESFMLGCPQLPAGAEQ